MFGRCKMCITKCLGCGKIKVIYASSLDGVFCCECLIEKIKKMTILELREVDLKFFYTWER